MSVKSGAISDTFNKVSIGADTNLANRFSAFVCTLLFPVLNADSKLYNMRALTRHNGTRTYTDLIKWIGYWSGATYPH